MLPDSTPARTSISRKIVMSLTGLWLCAFLAVHLAGNLTLYLPADQARPLYNAYTAFMTGNPVIRLVAYVNYGAILVHVVVSAVLSVQNRGAKGTPYAFDRPGETSPWYARAMGILGSLVLIFLVLHMRTFWFRYHFGEVPQDPDGLRDMYGVVTAAFRQQWYVALYVASIAAVGFHLLHGVGSGFRTLGVHHRRYWKLTRTAGTVFALVITAGFGLIPIYLYLTS